MPDMSSAAISSLPSEEPIDEPVEASRIDDLILEQLNTLRQENIALKDEIRALRSDMKLDKDDIRDLYAAIASLEHKQANVGKKSDVRKKALANQLVATKNTGMTYSQIGKFLELGSRNGNKNTREQNMTHFGKLLEADKKSFMVTPSKTSGGKLVKLTKAYYDHLIMGGQP